MKFNLKKKFLLLIFTIIFLLPNFFWLYLSYANKTFPYYELGYLYRKIDREVNKLFTSKEDYAHKIINKQYVNNNIFYEKENKIDTIYLPIKVKTININIFSNSDEVKLELAKIGQLNNLQFYTYKKYSKMNIIQKC